MRLPFEPKHGPVPDRFSEEMQIHFLLAFSPHHDPTIQYDLTLHPSTLDSEISHKEFAEPATHPPVSRLHVICPRLQWPITISSSSGTGFVTVLDVLESIYRVLRVPAKPTEYGSLPSHSAIRGVNAAYYRRCGRFQDRDSRQLEESKGIKRVDFLMGRNRFLGLSGTLKGPDIWELNVS